MNVLLWVLQVLAALLYGSSGVMKVFMFDKISQEVPSFGALPRNVWMALGVLELVCAVGLILSEFLDWTRGARDRIGARSRDGHSPAEAPAARPSHLHEQENP